MDMGSAASKKTAAHWRSTGFSLIEVMIVVVVIAVLASIAYPSYTSYLMRSNRSAAQQFMLDISNREEQYMLDARTYATGAGSVAALSMVVPSNVSPFYTIAIDPPAVVPPQGYRITATAIGSQASDGALTLDNTGAKTPAAKW
jgi:type IV pilus assembly protein PilE